MSKRAQQTTGVALGALVAAVISSLILDGDAARPGTWWGLVAAVAVVLAIAVVRAAGAATRRAWLLVALIALIPTVATGWRWLVDLDTGTPGALLVVLTLCGLVVAGAAVSGIIHPPPVHPTPVHDTEEDTTPSSVADRSTLGGTAALRRGIPVVVTPVITVVGLLAAGLLLAPVATSAAEHSRIAAPAEVQPVPETPTHAGWKSDTAPARNLLTRGGVVAAGSGFVTALGYAGAPAPGLAGVDGVTGELRWTYDLSQANPSGLAASPDGAYVIAVFVPRTERIAEASRLVVLDAHTGEPLWSRVGDPLFDAPQLAPTNTILPVFADDLRPAGDRRNLLGLDLATGDVRWTAIPPEGCIWSSNIIHSTAAASLQSQRCDDNTARLVALDQQSGVQQWSYTTDVAELTDGPVGDNWGFTDLIRTDPAGTVVTLVREISAVDGRIIVVLRADGSLAATIDRGYPVTRGPLVLIEGSDSGAILLPGVSEPIKIAALGPGCRNDSAVTTNTAVIGACRKDGASTGTWQLQIQSVDPIGDPAPIGDLPDRADQIVVAPGAVVVVVRSGGQIRYRAFH